MTKRAAARELLKRGTISVRAISRTTGVDKSVVSKLKTALSNKDHAALDRILDASKRRGAPSVLSAEEEAMVVKKCIFAARRGFALDDANLKTVMSRIAKDDRGTQWKSCIPSDDSVRSFRARHRELTYRSAENKELEKLKGEDFLHCKTYEAALRMVEEKIPGMFNDPLRLWNMEETNVTAENGKKKKVFSPADPHHGGFQVATTGSGSGKHITSVIAASPSGLVAPPFFIVAGKRVMSNWLLPVNDT